jgi:hypothetical protein
MYFWDAAKQLLPSAYHRMLNALGVSMQSKFLVAGDVVFWTFALERSPWNTTTVCDAEVLSCSQTRSTSGCLILPVAKEICQIFGHAKALESIKARSKCCQQQGDLANKR